MYFWRKIANIVIPARENQHLKSPLQPWGRSTGQAAGRRVVGPHFLTPRAGVTASIKVSLLVLGTQQDGITVINMATGPHP